MNIRKLAYVLAVVMLGYDVLSTLIAAKLYGRFADLRHKSRKAYISRHRMKEKEVKNKKMKGDKMIAIVVILIALSGTITIVSASSTSITVDVPNGGEVWGVGEPRFIVWHGSHPSSSPVKIDYSTDGGSSWSTVVASTPNDGSYQWTIPSTPSTQCRVNISDAATGTPSDVSDNDFTIFTSITVDVPNGGEVWGAGEPRFIVWHGSHPSSSPVKIEYSTDGGSSWSTVVASTPNDGSYQWTVPSTPSTQCRVNISDAATGTPFDVSDNDFTIFTSITVDVPNGGEVWGAGEPRFIVWHGSTPPSSPVKIEHSTDGGSSWSTIVASTPNDGSYQWTVPSTPSTQCRVQISDAATGTPSDVSDNDFTIVHAHPPQVPALTPIGILILIGLVSILGVIAIKKKQK